jgi:hypothetical protein
MLKDDRMAQHVPTLHPRFVSQDVPDTIWTVRRDALLLIDISVVYILFPILSL